MQDAKLPANRMILIGEHLINVDDISTVSAKHQHAIPMLGVVESKWLEIITRTGTKIVVQTDMTIHEFEIERAKKFTPVAPEKLKDANWGESDWIVDEVRTEWSYLHPGNREWVGVTDTGVAIDEARRLDTRYRAVMWRKIHKEWDVDD